ncbi:YceD family protein [Runella sp.]|uniref:YceD family protein n=1 Tax=Runella sp. TaxID=1960881 RepID=UPI003D0A2FF6
MRILINTANFAAHFDRKVKALTQYDIGIYGLKDKQYVYNFESGREFFEELEQDLIQNGHFKTHLTIDKSATMLILNFRIEGVVELVCDRSLENFEEPIDLTEKLILKFGDHDEILAEDIELIRHETVRINVAQYIFDFIALSLPMKKLHPRFRTEEDEEEDGLLVYQSTDEPEEQQDDADSSDNGEVDPRWAALQKLKGKE